MDREKMIQKLNDILRWEWTGVAQYAQASFVVTGVLREVYADVFSEGAEESFGHAKKIGEKIVALGGVPTIERAKVQQSDDLLELLRIGLEFERGAVKLYSEAIDLCDDEMALRVLLEDILLEEQDGVDHLEKLLRNQQPLTAAKETGKGKTKAG
jgi:bacterioferritin